MVLLESVKKVENKLQKINLFHFIIMMLLLVHVGALLTELICFVVGITDVTWRSRDFSTSKGIITAILGAIIVAPIIETVIFQKLPIENLYKKPFFAKRPYFLITLSALVFGSLHIFNSPGDAIGAFFSGLIFAWGYLIRYKVNKHPFVAIWLLHLAWNAIAVSVNVFFYS